MRCQGFVHWKYKPCNIVNPPPPPPLYALNVKDKIQQQSIPAHWLNVLVHKFVFHILY